MLIHVSDLLAIYLVIEARLALGAKLNLTVLESKEGIVLSYAYVVARENVRTALAEDDLADSDGLSMIDLDPQVLRI